MQYDKKGNVITDSQFDNFENYLTHQYFDTVGNIIEDCKIISINVNTKDEADFMVDPFKYTTFMAYQKKYTYSNKLCKNY